MALWQIILITLLAFLVPIDKYGMTFGLRWPVITTAIVGVILGDMKTALYIGGTLQLMSLGVASIGGSSVPEYSVAGIIAAVVASTTNQNMEAGIAIGLPVAMLGVQFDIIAKLVNGFIVKKAQLFLNNGNFKKMNGILLVAPVIMGLTAAIPVFIAITFGVSIIENLLTILPEWFFSGLTVAGNVLPVVGIALLLTYMPIKKHFIYLMIGYFLSAYLGVPILGVTIVGVIAAVYFLQNQNNGNNAVVVNGGLEDE